MTCVICCENYTKELRKEITCPECKKTVCLSCFKRHIDGNTIMTCIFPDCDKEFNLLEIKKITGNNNAYTKALFVKIAQTNLEQEKNFLPNRQVKAKTVLEERKYHERSFKRQALMTEIRKSFREEDSKLREEIKRDKEIEELDNQINKLKNLKKEKLIYLVNEKDEKLRPYKIELDKIRDEDIKDRENLGIVKESKENHYTFIKSCPYPNCKGFLKDNPNEKGWSCPLCENLTCRKCHEPLNTKDHVCDKNILENIKEMKKDTRPCPNCGTGISKIDGCDVMFCILCQKYYSWKTGKIFTKSLHNPEAVRWMRENGRAINREREDINGGCTDPFINNIVYIEWLYFHQRNYFSKDKKIFDTIVETINNFVHIIEVELPKFEDKYPRKSEEFAIEFLINEEYNEEKWVRDIRVIKKQQMLNKEFSEIINLAVEISRTVFINIRDLVDRNSDISTVKEQLNLIPSICKECNEKFEIIKKCLDSKRKLQFFIEDSNFCLYNIYLR